MPLLTFQHQPSSLIWAVWNITESPEELVTVLPEGEILPPEITNTRKRAEWLAGRVLVKHVLTSQGIAYQGLEKDSYGKPWITGQPRMQLSLSNSYPLVAAAIHPELPVGIDIERPRSSMLQVVPRILSDQENMLMSGDIGRACMLWCAKEAMFKWHGKKHVSMRHDFSIQVLPENAPGYLSATGLGERIRLYAHRVKDHILVLTESNY